mmetsp:Transcript_2441/g.5107  ORF Transcript_2441/g.5107 Transcript_2441/m.5107 type:complete len:190 (-) Transcript_2441:170-739(-)
MSSPSSSAQEPKIPAEMGMAPSEPTPGTPVPGEKPSFIEYDLNRNGTLDFQELCKLLRRGDPSLTDKDVRALFDALDKDKDGNVRFKEMSEYLRPGATFEHNTWRGKKLRAAFNLSRAGPADDAANDKGWMAFLFGEEVSGVVESEREILPSYPAPLDKAGPGEDFWSSFWSCFCSCCGTRPKAASGRP